MRWIGVSGEGGWQPICFNWLAAIETGEKAASACWCAYLWQHCEFNSSPIAHRRTKWVFLLLALLCWHTGRASGTKEVYGSITCAPSSEIS